MRGEDSELSKTLILCLNMYDHHIMAAGHNSIRLEHLGQAKLIISFSSLFLKEAYRGGRMNFNLKFRNLIILVGVTLLI